MNSLAKTENGSVLILGSVLKQELVRILGETGTESAKVAGMFKDGHDPEQNIFYQICVSQGDHDSEWLTKFSKQ